MKPLQYRLNVSFGTHNGSNATDFLFKATRQHITSKHYVGSLPDQLHWEARSCSETWEGKSTCQEKAEAHCTSI